MNLDKQQGLIDTAEFILSPNHDQRPADICPDLLVIHNISLPPGEYGTPYVRDFFSNRLDTDIHPYFQSIADLRVSSHLYIERNGQLTQFVPFHLRAWHAGVSSYQGRVNCNDFSIGIELEGTDNQSYTKEQYLALIEVSQLLIKHYAISTQRIVGHSDIAPERKTDPGPAFDWNHYLDQLTGE